MSNKGIALHATSAAIIDFYISDLKSTTNGDTGALCGSNGAGPFKIVNNYIEGAGENVVGSVTLAGGKYRLTASNPYKNVGTNGRDSERILTRLIGDCRGNHWFATGTRHHPSL